ncbi:MULTISPECIES: hypothetical protein [Rhodococcus]|uniref:hypothetical protein n=1 Tax=Rhodococcus TaxID=1827 RepID=UPI001C4EB181|nr:hypothetical protein [Rhodococcus sp. FH8]
MSQARSKPWILFSLLLISALSAGCSEARNIDASNPSPTSIPSVSSYSSNQNSTSTVMPPEKSIPKSVQVPEDEHTNDTFTINRSPGTFSLGCNNSEELPKDGVVFDSLSGKFFPLPIPSVTSSEELVKAYCTVAGPPDRLRIIYILSLRIPASGLEVEKPLTRTVSYALDTPGAVANYAWPAPIGTSIDEIAATNFGFIVRVGNNFTGFDLDTLEPTWERNDGPVYDSSFNGLAFVREIGFESGLKVVINDASTGSELQNLSGFQRATEGKDFQGQSNYGWFLRHGYKNPDNDVFYFDASSKKLIGPLSPYAEGMQRHGDLLLTYRRDNVDKNNFINIFDIKKNDYVLRKIGSEVSGLNFSEIYVAGNYLYIKNDTESSVTDLRTLTKVSQGWSARPMDLIGTDWILSIKGPVTNQYVNCFDGDGFYMCKERAVLVHSPNGAYPGPWY